MTLLITSFIAGFLTILAPCVLPLLPITLGGAVADARNRRRPLIIIASLSVSVFVFTLLLKGSTALLDVSPSVWTYISAAILGIYGLSLVFPYAWAKLMLKMPGHRMGEQAVSDSHSSAVIVGLALGPVFTTCSPTFFLILATVLPQSLGAGIIDLVAYVVGLALALLLVSWIGQKLVTKLEWTINPTGWFRRTLGVLFVLIAVFIGVGWDKQVESAILQSGFFDVTTLEQKIHQSLEDMPRASIEEQDAQNGSACDPSKQGCFLPNGAATSTTEASAKPANATAAKADLTKPIPGEEKGGRYTEIANPAGFVNSAPIKLADFIGKKVILVDFIDYSCINCERTFPYMKDWWSKYKDQGLEIVAIHTPEFSFERDQKNVEAAAKQFGLRFPIVLDNSYATWNAYRNQYWPHKYIIDIHGNVVYEHIGEGEYDNTEMEIVKQLNIRKQFLGESGTVQLGADPMPANYLVQTASPETYFGASRNEFFGNDQPGQVGKGVYETPVILDPNKFYLGGVWSIMDEYAQASASSTVSYIFTAANMYLVAESANGSPVRARVMLDGQPIPAAVAGDDVKDGILMVNASRLYSLYKNQLPGRHRIDIIWSDPGAKLYTFTFG
jgi:cytochrome c biogenesis protein CcdA/thiol-disulfide isomerase/thioredoxin